MCLPAVLQHKKKERKKKKARSLPLGSFLTCFLIEREALQDSVLIETEGQIVRDEQQLQGRM